MPERVDKDVYPEPPSRTPVVERSSTLPDTGLIVSKLYYFAIDLPVTTLREWVERQQQNNHSVYYHRQYRRVPMLTECTVGDLLCYYEADSQWKRDLKVDREIVKIMQERMQACFTREGQNYKQNCLEDMQKYKEVNIAFESRYGDLGALGNARRCLMKQKHRMMKERREGAEHA